MKYNDIFLKIFLISVLFICFNINCIYGQNGFVTSRNGKFYLGDNEYNFHGVNTTYLLKQNLLNDTNITKVLIDELEQLNVKVIRISAHLEGSSINGFNAIMRGPYDINENALRVLDKIIDDLSKKNIKVVMILCDNWGYYGGKEQYLSWAIERGMKPHPDDFFRLDSLKNWYKYYVSSLIKRKNTVTGKFYFEDNSVFSWELMNEPRSNDPSGNVVFNWLKEMSEYIKSIDPYHLIGTGEEGFDNTGLCYSDKNYFYNGNSLLFNGFYGISFTKNLNISSIDYSNIHVYQGYGFNEIAGITWVNDHLRLSKKSLKPLLIGEYSSRTKNLDFLKSIINISSGQGSYGLYWQYIPVLLKFNDGFGINLHDDKILCNLIKEANNSIFSNKDSSRYEIITCFPNPFSEYTRIILNLPNYQKLEISLVDILGREFKVTDNEFDKGISEIIFNPNSFMISSGFYILKVRSDQFLTVKKIIYRK